MNIFKKYARRAFFEVFARVKGIDVLGPTIVRHLPVGSPYQSWLEKVNADLPLLREEKIDDVTTLPLQPWAQLGKDVTGQYLRFADHQMIDGRIFEIPVGRNTAGQRLFCEQDVYIISGGGYTALQQEGKPEQRLTWNEGDLFSVPLNVHHRHYGSGETPARILVISNFPMMLNLLGDEKIISENPFVSFDRYDGAPDYFKQVKDEKDLQLETNIVRDILRLKTRPYDYRGKGNTTFRPLMAGNTMLCAHVSEMPPKAYKKAHRQTGEAFILALGGEGYSLAWPEAAWYKKRRIDWKAGSLFSPPAFWYHQNFNPGSEPARYLAINTPTPVTNLGLRFSDQLEVDLEEVKNEWRKELKKRQYIQE